MALSSLHQRVCRTAGGNLWVDTFQPIENTWFPLVTQLLSTLSAHALMGGVFGGYVSFLAARFQTFDDLDFFVYDHVVLPYVFPLCARSEQTVQMGDYECTFVACATTAEDYPDYTLFLLDIRRIYNWTCKHIPTGASVNIQVMVITDDDETEDIPAYARRGHGLDFARYIWQVMDFGWCCYAVVKIGSQCVCLQDTMRIRERWRKSDLHPMKRLLKYKEKSQCRLTIGEIYLGQSCAACSICLNTPGSLKSLCFQTVVDHPDCF